MKPNLIIHALYAAILTAGASLVSLSSATGALAAIDIGQQGALSFVSGGVGEEERQEIMKLSPNYPLELLFAAKGEPNEYLADVKVRIKDKNGKVVLETISQGPFLLAKLPPGRYSISADNDGASKQQTVQVEGTRLRRVVFVW
jgi:hypothetical protein